MQQPTNNLAAGARVTHKGTGELGTVTEIGTDDLGTLATVEWDNPGALELPTTLHEKHLKPVEDLEAAPDWQLVAETRHRAFSLRREADGLIAQAEKFEALMAAKAIQESGIPADAFRGMTVEQVAKFAEEHDVEPGGIIRAVYEMQEATA